MKAKQIFHTQKPYEFHKTTMPHKMNKVSEILTYLGGGGGGLWAMSHSDFLIQVPAGVYLSALATILFFLLKFVVGSLAGGVLGGLGGDLYTKGKEIFKKQLEKRKIKK